MWNTPTFRKSRQFRRFGHSCVAAPDTRSAFNLSAGEIAIVQAATR